MLRKLTAVAPRDNDSLTVRRGQALALVMVIFIIVTAALGCVNSIIRNLPAVGNSAIGLAFFALVYAINRRGQLRLAVTIFLSGGALLVINAAVITQRPIPVVFFLSVIVVMAAGLGSPHDPLIWAVGLTGVPFAINLLLYHSLTAPMEQFRLPEGTSMASVFFLELVAIGLLWMFAGTAYLTSQLLHGTLNESYATAADAAGALLCRRGHHRSRAMPSTTSWSSTRTRAGAWCSTGSSHANLGSSLALVELLGAGATYPAGEGQVDAGVHEL